LRRLRLSLFEKVILVNSLVLVGEALAGLWVTSHNLEAHHYLIDTSFIVLATVLSVLINIVLLRASFRPLFNLLSTIRAVSAGKTHARALVTPSDSEIGELAQAFNSMLDRLEAARREQTMLILQAQEEERRRLALELHDESSQNLTALLIQAEVLHQSLQVLPDTTTLQDVREQLNGGAFLYPGLAKALVRTYVSEQGLRVTRDEAWPVHDAQNIQNEQCRGKPGRYMMRKTYKKIRILLRSYES